MYFPVGWPKYLELQDSNALPISVFCNRDRTLFGVLTEDSISIWFIRVRKIVLLICYLQIMIHSFGDNFEFI